MTVASASAPFVAMIAIVRPTVVTIVPPMMTMTVIAPLTTTMVAIVMAIVTAMVAMTVAVIAAVIVSIMLVAVATMTVDTEYHFVRRWQPQHFMRERNAMSVTGEGGRSERERRDAYRGHHHLHYCAFHLIHLAN